MFEMNKKGWKRLKKSSSISFQVLQAHESWSKYVTILAYSLHLSSLIYKHKKLNPLQYLILVLTSLTCLVLYLGMIHAKLANRRSSRLEKFADQLTRFQPPRTSLTVRITAPLQVNQNLMIARRLWTPSYLRLFPRWAIPWNWPRRPCAKQFTMFVD